MADALEAAEKLFLEIRTEEIQIMKSADDAINGFLGRLAYAAAFDVFAWIQLSRNSGMDCSILKPLAILLLAFTAMGILLSAFCAFRKVQKTYLDGLYLLPRLLDVEELLKKCHRLGGEKSDALPAGNQSVFLAAATRVAGSRSRFELNILSKIIKRLRFLLQWLRAIYQSFSPATATTTAGGQSQFKLKTISEMVMELRFQLRWLRTIYLIKILLLLLPMFLLITWELLYVDKCYGRTKYRVPVEPRVAADRSSPEHWSPGIGVRHPSRGRRVVSGYGTNFQHKHYGKPCKCGIECPGFC